MSKYHFKDGEEVVHKDNLNQKMTVSRILKESKEIVKGFDEVKQEPIKEKVSRMIGIECHWWGYVDGYEEKILLKHKFHSSELVPKVIAEKGIEEVNNWLRAQNK